MTHSIKRRLGQTLGLFLLFNSSVFAQTTEPLEQVNTENSYIRFQATYTPQRHAAFRSDYASQNSLTSARDKMYTASVTAHAGARLWEGGEGYLNVEAAQGVPFTRNLIGLGTYTNGEITRAAGAQPIYYRQRLFLRQTWNQGGGQEILEPELNQLAGTVDKNRVVLTAGNFSILDVFDDNAYAKDIRLLGRCTRFWMGGNT